MTETKPPQDVLKRKNRAILLLQTTTDEQRVRALATEAAELEAQLADYWLGIGDEENAAISLASQAHCLLRATALDDANAVVERALRLAAPRLKTKINRVLLPKLRAARGGKGFFQVNAPTIFGNDPPLREPQWQGYERIRDYYNNGATSRETAIVLPVGCGKTGLMTLAPFAVRSRRALAVAPYVKIAEQIHAAFDPTHTDDYFYGRFGVVPSDRYPEPVEIRGKSTNVGDLQEAEVVITNIDQLQGKENRWLTRLPHDFFDLIMFDEGHHAVAESWDVLRQAFPQAKIVNFSATPKRADGQMMPGEVIYSYPVRRAIRKGYVKKLKALVLNPRTLRYVREEDGEEIEVTLDQIKSLGESDAKFRRGVVSSPESLQTIVDASLRELVRIRTETGDNRHKVIASALNQKHAIQIKECYEARNYRAGYVHSKESKAYNAKVMEKLERHQLDVIVQVRKLGEGFDHPFISVAAVCSIFAELSPFVQFVGRAMRIVRDDTPGHAQTNEGAVVFHAGGNVAQRWQDFQEFSSADQDYFAQLMMPVEELDFSSSDEIVIEPDLRQDEDDDLGAVGPTPPPSLPVIKHQEDVQVQAIPLFKDEKAVAALKTLREQGYTAEEILEAYQHVPMPTTRVKERQAKRSSLDDLIRHHAGRILKERGMNMEGRELDKARLDRSNWLVLKARIDTLIKERVANKDRADYVREELDRAHNLLDGIIAEVEAEFFDG